MTRPWKRSAWTRNGSRDGHDGTWVAHPELVPTPSSLQRGHARTQQVTGRGRRHGDGGRPAGLRTEGPNTEAGLRTNVNVGIQYLRVLVQRNRCVPIFNLMEDAPRLKSALQICIGSTAPRGAGRRPQGDR
jgi:malate synthase